jgi:hypothetical protein
MKGKHAGRSSNIVRLCVSRPDPPSTAAILEGVKLMRVFLSIEAGRDRKRVLELARKLAPIDADAKT